MNVSYVRDTEDIGHIKDKSDAIILDPKCEEFDRQLQLAFYYKFHHPIIKDEKVKSKPYLLLSKEQKEDNFNSYDTFLNKVKFALKNYKYNGNVCSNYIVLSREVIEYLKYYTISHKFKTKNGYEQKERLT